MKIANVFLIIFTILAGCHASESSYNDLSNQIIAYQIDDTTYGVVVPQDGGVSQSAARQFARQKAAEMTVEKGYRYFTIQSEQQTKLAKSNREWPSSQDFPGNLYQELIIEQDFGRESLERNTPSGSSIIPAYRITFQMHTNRPMQSAIDACTLTDCAE